MCTSSTRLDPSLNDTDRKQWRRTSPLAAVYFLGKLYEAIAKNAVQSFAPLAAFLVAYKGDLASKAVIAVSAFILITLAIAILRYLFFRFQIGDESILIRDGVINRTQVDIKFDRIQAVNTEQNLLFRFFRLTTVRFDTAGSSQQEGVLPGIGLALADELKERLGSVIAERNEEQDTQTDESAVPAPALRPMLRYGFADIVKVGLSSNRSLILLAFLAPVIGPITEALEARFDESDVADAAIQANEIGVAGGIGLFLLLIVVVVALLMLVSVAGAFLRYHRFELQTDGEQFRSNGGLLTRQEHAMRFTKIQSVHINQNVLHRMFDRLKVRAKQAASGRQSMAKHFMVPLVEPDLLPEIKNLSFGKAFNDADLDPRSDLFQRISPHYLRSRALLFGLLPAFTLTAVFALPFGGKALWFLLWVPVAALYFLQRHRRFGVRVGSEGIAVRDGVIGYRVVAHLIRKVQRIDVTQSPFQRRKGLATARLFLASGSVRIPFVPARDAFRLRDYVLYKVESSELAWH